MYHKKLGTEKEREAFKERFNSVNNRLLEASKKTKEKWAEQKRVEHTLESIEAAQSSIYCYGKDFGVHTKEDVMKRMEALEKTSSAEKTQEAKPVRTFDSAVDEIILSATSRSNKSIYEGKLKELGSSKDSDDFTK